MRRPGGQRLVREDLGDVEQLVGVLDADHPGLAQHLRERARRGVRRPDGVPGRHHLAGPPGRHDDHGLDQRQPPGHPGELARVAQRLEVQADDVRAVVVGPELHEVVAGHVGAVPGGHELRDPDAPAPDRREQRDGQRGRLAEQPDPPRRRRGLRQRRVELQTALPRRDDPVGARADHPHPGPVRRAEHRALPVQAVGAVLGEPRASAGRSRARRGARGPGPRRSPRRRARRRRRARPVRARPRAARAPAAAGRPGRRPRARPPTGPRRGGPPARARPADPRASRPRPSPGPTTTTDDACRTPRIDSASARCSRSAITASDRSVGSMSNPTATMPSSVRCRTSYPACLKTAIMRPFCGRTSATNRRTPRSRAAAARCSSSTDPSPRPWWASAMLKATSASSVPMRSYRATPMIWSTPSGSVRSTPRPARPGRRGRR